MGGGRRACCVPGSELRLGVREKLRLGVREKKGEYNKWDGVIALLCLTGPQCLSNSCRFENCKGVFVTVPVFSVPVHCIQLSIYSSSIPRAQHSTAQRNHPCTKQQTKYVRADQSTYQKKYARTCVRRPGCFPGAWSSGRLQVACFAPKMLDHLLHLSFRSILPCERA